MKRENLFVFFALFVGIALLVMWFYLSPNDNASGAILGVPGTDPISPLMAVLLVIWFMLVGFVVYVNRPER